ncbi:hypothetical protein AZH51_10215 [Branchiibius sp. NY16-3462-2]|nr:hypothetical protein AZH51_10215 [Branchiibius sp. NY16-3462-2]
MGIRYSAVAFDAHLSDIARESPYRVYRRDPFDRLKGIGCLPTCDHSSRDWHEPCRGCLLLDKAWRDLQMLTEPEWPEAARPAYRMFEGDVTYGTDWSEEFPWVAAIQPEDVPAIRDDLLTLGVDDFAPAVQRRRRNSDPVTDCFDYEVMFLEHAKKFMTWLAEDGRGMVYLIG